MFFNLWEETDHLRQTEASIEVVFDTQWHVQVGLLVARFLKAGPKVASLLTILQSVA